MPTTWASIVSTVESTATRTVVPATTIPLDELVRIDRAAAVEILVGRRRGDDRRRPGGRVLEICERDLLRRRGGGRIGLARDERPAGGQGPGVDRRLNVPPLGRDPSDVDRHARECQQHDEEDGEDDEHLPARRGAAHQFTTIVVVACWTKRPFASWGRSALMNGTTMSDRYVSRTCTRHPAGSSVAQ